MSSSAHLGDEEEDLFADIYGDDDNEPVNKPKSTTASNDQGSNNAANNVPPPAAASAQSNTEQSYATTPQQQFQNAVPNANYAAEYRGPEQFLAPNPSQPFGQLTAQQAQQALSMQTGGFQASQQEDGSGGNRQSSHYEPKEDGKMFIGGLNWETTDETLKNYFSEFGEVVECQVMRDTNTGRSRGFGFLTFKDSKCVNAVMVREHVLDGKIIDPKRAIPREEQDKTSKIFVGGVSQECTEAEFKDFFSQFGRIIDATLMMDKDTGRPRGFGFVTFDSDTAVENTLTRAPLYIKDKLIEVKKAQPRGSFRNNQELDNRSNNNNYYQNYQQQQQQPYRGQQDQQSRQPQYGGPQGAYGYPMGGYMMPNAGGQEGYQDPQGVGNPTAQAASAFYGGMTPAMMAQYWQRMQTYYATMQQQMASANNVQADGQQASQQQMPQQQQQQQQQQPGLAPFLAQQYGQGFNQPYGGYAQFTPQQQQLFQAQQLQQQLQAQQQQQQQPQEKSQDETPQQQQQSYSENQSQGQTPQEKNEAGQQSKEDPISSNNAEKESERTESPRTTQRSHHNDERPESQNSTPAAETPSSGQNYENEGRRNNYSPRGHGSNQRYHNNNNGKQWGSGNDSNRDDYHSRQRYNNGDSRDRGSYQGRNRSRGRGGGAGGGGNRNRGKSFHPYSRS